MLNVFTTANIHYFRMKSLYTLRYIRIQEKFKNAVFMFSCMSWRTNFLLYL